MQRFGILSPTKTCKICGEEKPLTAEFFYKRKGSKDGFKNECKACVKKRVKEWAEGNSEKTTGYKRKWSKNNRVTDRQLKANWQKDNPEKMRQYSKNYKATFPEKIREQKLNKRYGITISQYDEMFEKQDGICAICGLPEITRRLSVDHCHVTGKIRGLLCSDCNLAIGNFKDDTKRMEGAITYIGEYRHE